MTIELNHEEAALSQLIVGREHELKILKRLLASSRAEFLAIYGRRRVGKTFLIHEFFKDKGVYFTLTGTLHSNKKQQLRHFHRELANTFPDFPLDNNLEDWDTALYALRAAIKDIDLSQRIIIFFDELPWLAGNRSGFLPALEYAWNQYFSRQSNVVLIVCGSAASWIIKKVINNKGGLYGRLTEMIQLHPFNLLETEQYLSANKVKLSRKQIVELYMAIGGIAKYLTYVLPGESSAQAINRLCFTPQGPLLKEFSNLYRSLFDTAEKHVACVKGLAAKKYGMSQQELVSTLPLSSGGHLSSILEELEVSGFISACPEYGKKKRERHLWLIDEYSYFYLTWIEGIKSGIILGHDTDYWLKMHNDPRWKSWAGYAFEAICLKHIAQLKKALGISAVLTSESQWTYKSKEAGVQGAQIDLVIDRRDDCINLCEIKFHNGPFIIDRAYADILRYKVDLFRTVTKSSKTLFLTFITPFGLNKNRYAQELVHQELTLNDLF